MKWWTCTRTGDIAHLKIGDDIGVFEASIDELELELEHASQIHVEVNSGGGDARTALRLFRSLRNRTRSVIVRRAHSMGAIIALAGDERLIHAGGSIMVHPLQLAAYGNEAELRAAVDDMVEMTAQVMDILTKRTRAPAELIQGWMSDGQDRYLDAETALEFGFVHEILPAEESSAEPEANAAAVQAGVVNDGSEALLLEMLRALGPVETRDPAGLARELSNWFARSVQKIE